MTQGKLTVANKAAEAGEKQYGTSSGQAGGLPSPPTYEEATGSGVTASPCYNETYPSDGEMLTEFSWSDKNIRRIFIRKVYTMLMIQLLVTLSIVSLFTFCEPVRDYIQSNPGWYWASYAVFFVTYLTLACCPGPRRQFPFNLILLTIFTLSLSYMTGMLSSYYNTKSVVICLGITAAVCLIVTLVSFQTKFDVTSYRGVLFTLCLVMMVSGLVLAIVLPYGCVPWLHGVYGALGALLFTMFLAIDTQQLMGNKRYTISPEEYVFATLNIYLDIIYIFSFSLSVFGSERTN
ncbi:protein lifeguard 2 [Esox lucius]|uniref:Protein lifeguard 2 n=1 Tax=Esox lucius TaxID=8010 RepID=A0AAY5KCM4_ESOLU|nr:protein lifeguard 2 [Esox lucius]